MATQVRESEGEGKKASGVLLVDTHLLRGPGPRVSVDTGLAGWLRLGRSGGSQRICPFR